MWYYYCANHSAFSLRPIFKRLSEDDVRIIDHFEAYCIFANDFCQWSLPVNYLIVNFSEFISVHLEIFTKIQIFPEVTQLRVSVYV